MFPKMTNTVPAIPRALLKLCHFISPSRRGVQFLLSSWIWWAWWLTFNKELSRISAMWLLKVGHKMQHSFCLPNWDILLWSLEPLPKRSDYPEATKLWGSLSHMEKLPTCFCNCLEWGSADNQPQICDTQVTTLPGIQAPDANTSPSWSWIF